MAESNENQVQDEKAVKKVRKSRSGFWFGIIILLVIISLAGAGYFLLDQLREKQEGLGGEIVKDDAQISELTKQITGYQTQIAAIQSQLANLNAEVTGTENHYNDKLAEFSKLHNDKLESARNELNTSIKRIQLQLGKTRGDWLLADAEYLISVANQRLHLMGDVNTTLEALKAADQRLRESGDTAAFKVREQLAKEIAGIEKIEMPDIVGIYSQIQVLEDHIDKLTLFLPYAGKGLTKPEPIEEQAPQDDDDGGVLDSALDELGDLVTIRHTDKPVKSVLTEEEAVFIREQLRVKLEMVKIALLQNNDPLFKKNIDEARKWVHEHFMIDSNAKSFLAGLDQINGVVLRRQLPDISQSLKMLRDITKLRIETDKALQAEEPTGQ